ncbi:MAG: phosphoesterase, partial [Gammaproteobacteria bacterium]|nr:phosphoesterase [Gammaproteobacteria bacterium]
MLRWIIPLLIASAIIFVLEYYAFQAVKTVTKNRVIKWVWLGIGLLVYLNLLYVIFSTPSNSGQTKQFQM